MEEQFIKIYNLYKDDVFRLAYSYSNNIYDSDDILQNVFIKLYKHQNIFNLPNLEIKKWLFRVTINECKNNLLTFWKKSVHYITKQEVNSYSELIKDNEVINAVMKLDSKKRLIVYLYYYEGYKIKEISKMLNKTETNIQTILSRARIELKNILGDENNE